MFIVNLLNRNGELLASKRVDTLADVGRFVTEIQECVGYAPVATWEVQ